MRRIQHSRLFPSLADTGVFLSAKLMHSLCYICVNILYKSLPLSYKKTKDHVTLNDASPISKIAQFFILTTKMILCMLFCNALLLSLCNTPYEMVIC